MRGVSIVVVLSASIASADQVATAPTAAAKPEAKTDAKPEAKPEAKPDAKTEAKPDAKTEAKPDPKAEKKALASTKAEPNEYTNDPVLGLAKRINGEESPGLI